MTPLIKSSAKLLAIDCATEVGRVALCNKGAVQAVQLSDKRHGEQLLPVIQALLDENNVSLQTLDAVAIVNGPGSLTGIRLACTLVQVLAWANRLPVIPLNSLVALGWDSLQRQDCACILDARMGQVFVTRICCGKWQAAEMAARHVSVEKAKAYLQIYHDRQWPVYFKGRQDTAARLADMGVALVEAEPSADKLADYALARWRAGGVIPAASLQPCYLADWSAG